MYLTKEELLELPRFDSTGRNCYCYIDEDENLFIKKFISISEKGQREATVRYLLERKYIDGSAYPIEELYLDNEFWGYACKYYKDTKTFRLGREYSHDEKIKAISDINEQLKEVHQRNIIFHDISLNNFLIGNSGGHLVDFEDAMPMAFSRIPRVSYILKKKKIVLSPTPNIDKFKQLICNLSLLYDIDLESYLNGKNYHLESLTELFSFNEALTSFTTDYFRFLKHKDLPYFDTVINEFKDKDRVESEKKKLRKQL